MEISYALEKSDTPVLFVTADAANHGEYYIHLCWKSFWKFPPSPYTPGSFVTGSFTLETSLGPNANATILYPASYPGLIPPGDLISFSFSDGVQTIDSSGGTLNDVIRDIRTDASGNIVFWGSIQLFNSAGGQIYSNGNLMIGTGGYGSGEDYASNGSVSANNNYNPGTWTMEITSPVPEPSSLALLGSGTLAVIGIARRRALPTKKP